MVRSLLIRGMLVGLAAGLFCFVFARLFGEPSVASAIGYEDAVEHAAGAHDHGTELVSRSTQSGIGLATAVGVYGVAIGGIFALAFSFAYGRIGRLGPRGAAAVLAAGGFLAVYLVPFLKYPANPPAVGQANTIQSRTSLYLIAVLLSVGAAVAAVYLGRRLMERFGGWNAALLAGAAFLVFTVVVQMLLPSVSEVPANFPAATLWHFRIASVGTQLLLWTVLGLGFGPLAAKVLGGTQREPVVQLR